MRRRGKQAVELVLAMTLLVYGVSCGKSKEEKVAPEKAPGKPQITADQPELDFGAVKEGVEVTRVFKIRNTGKADLLIEKARGS